MSALSIFKFTPPLLINSSFSMKRPQKPDDVVNIHLCRNIIKNAEDNSALVELRVQLNKEEEKENEDPCFVAEVTLQSMFSWPKELDQEKADALLRVNAPALLISYARPIFVQLTAASPAPTYNLPFLNMNELFKEEPVE